MEQNRLFPVFLKLEELHTLLVGAGNVGLEKLTAILKNSPEARITVVAPFISEPVRELAESHPRVRLLPRKFRRTDLVGADVVILATSDRALHERIRKETRKRGILINVADTPDLCDFYLGSIVTKGNLRIGISTNGKSPTIARRIREFFELALPDEADELLTNMNRIRDRIAGDLKEKVKTLNEITASWLEKK
ncbi:MAG: bifunctional precorrin-2 dehydrogenase/sirohydrochlorin ferrochelatase [Bacteroidota bacterium]|jgi:precorrin-2 dehydrogenase/sirohydrochlorin ferrochelatase|nr:MAG: siroheme synthase [Bacteroidota bacterium]